MYQKNIYRCTFCCVYATWFFKNSWLYITDLIKHRVFMHSVNIPNTDHIKLLSDLLDNRALLNLFTDYCQTLQLTLHLFDLYYVLEIITFINHNGAVYVPLTLRYPGSDVHNTHIHFVSIKFTLLCLISIICWKLKRLEIITIQYMDRQPYDIRDAVSPTHTHTHTHILFP